MSRETCSVKTSSPFLYHSIVECVPSFAGIGLHVTDLPWQKRLVGLMEKEMLGVTSGIVDIVIVFDVAMDVADEPSVI